jgi:uncharacterized protein YvpB
MKMVLAAVAVLFFFLGYLGTHITIRISENLYVGQADGPENKNSVLILNVPFQRSADDFYCSEASASMVLEYYGYEVSQREVHVHSERFETMVPFLRGFIDCELVTNFGPDDLKAEISCGNPVMIRILPNKNRHTIVIVGYDESHLYAHDPDAYAFLKTDPDVLLKYWEPMGFAAITCGVKENIF